MSTENKTEEVAAACENLIKVIDALWGIDYLLTENKTSGILDGQTVNQFSEYKLIRLSTGQKTAPILSLIPLPDDAFHNAVKAAAKYICQTYAWDAKNSPDHWRYATQYASSATLWICDRTDESIIVYPEQFASHLI